MKKPIIHPKPILLSGMQPSGQLTIGHYTGAISSWLAMQARYDCLFMLVDLHTLTVRQDPNLLRERCYEVLALYIACGIDPEHSTVFIQSQVPQHTQLAWILNCFTYMGELNRMTQFKEKSQRHASNINAGLFAYPVLMAADILLYGSQLVPVGEDQKQHLELTRDLAIRFNNEYGAIFTVPEPYIPAQGARIMSLQEPNIKMSKSDANANNYIALLDSEDIIVQKLKRSVTDSGNEVYYDPLNKPGLANLLTIFSSCTGDSIEQLEEMYRHSGYGRFKMAVAEALVAHLKPIQQRYHELRQQHNLLEAILHQGAARAQDRANTLLKAVQNAVGLII